MHTFTISRLIDSPIEKVWAQIADVTLIKNWHPGVKTTDQLSSNVTGLGATRRCNFYDGSEAVEEVVEISTPTTGSKDEYKIKINIREFKAPMKTFESTWQLTPTQNGTTQITVTTQYEMKLGILGKALDLLLIRNRMPKLFGKVLAGLGHHVVSGEIIHKGFVSAA